jgi:hypothetical protein
MRAVVVESIANQSLQQTSKEREKSANVQAWIGYGDNIGVKQRRYFLVGEFQKAMVISENFAQV